jgi:hypothetical protein
MTSKRSSVRRNPAAQLGIAILLLCIGALAEGAGGRVPDCDPNGRNFCALPGVEDIAFLPRSDWMLTGSMFVNSRTKQRVPFALPFGTPAKRPSQRFADLSAPDCPGLPTTFHPGGNDIKRVGSEIRLVVINAGDRSSAQPRSEVRIELFSVDITNGVPQPHWLGCFPVPAEYGPNDVAIGPRGDIYFSNANSRTNSPDEAQAQRQKWLAREATGYAVQWRRGEGWVKVAGTDVPFANGVGVSHDDRTFAVAGTYCQCLILVDRRTGAVRRVPIGVSPDNITPLKRGGWLAQGNTGAPVTGVDPCRPPGNRPCGFPMAVVHIDPKGIVTYLFEDDGSRIPGPSVAVLHGEELFMGSAFADFVTVIDRPANAPLE